MKKIILTTLAALVATGSVFASYGTAAAQDYPYRPRYDRGGPPPPPYREHRRHNDGAAIAGGLAAGVIGGLIGGAIANGGNSGPSYYEPPPPPRPRCWFEDRRVPNSYDGGWHTESMRVCD
ncbi:hypothetical protein A6U97_12205 [Agrobacterium tumefaciens]|uniref:hypothetical protein n=1 Tax=Agrobacterium tumefaciens TaxID=358 RepID=UPI00081007CB|nr:hypothetical protein A6U97_12205 [Agrobacterium tumefaciens]